MKKYVHLMLAFAFLGTGQLFAQDNQECLQNLSIFAENAKVKNYAAAYEPWAKVKNDCPSLNVAIYSYGERILKDRIKNGEASAKADLQSKHQFTGLIPLYIKPFLYISARALVSEDSILESIVK